MTLEDTKVAVADHMEKITSYFKPGVKITVLVRVPEYPTRDFMMTDDDIDELVGMIQRRKAALKTN